MLGGVGTSGVASIGARGAECHPDSKKKSSKIKKIGKKRGHIGKKSRKRGKNRDEKAKIGKVLSLCPSFQIGLATLLVGTQALLQLVENMCTNTKYMV